MAGISNSVLPVQAHPHHPPAVDAVSGPRPVMKPPYPDPFQPSPESMPEPSPTASVTPSLQTVFFRIQYAKAEDLAAMIQGTHPTWLPAHGWVRWDPRTNILVIRAASPQIAAIRKLIHTLDIPVAQVYIEARIVEVKKNMGSALGIQWNLTPALPHSPNFHVELPLPPASLATSQWHFRMAHLPVGMWLDGELAALQSEGRVQLVSAPRLITTHQTEALIEHGQDIPYPETNSHGTTSMVFKKAVLRLQVIPHITPDHQIILQLEMHNDGKSTHSVSHVPIINTHHLKTAIVVPNGQTVVLGGIYKRDQEHHQAQVPFLHRLPVVGALFHNHHQWDTRHEIMVFITPSILDPAPG